MLFVVVAASALRPRCVRVACAQATLLRSQLEPWSTLVLRRRLVADFGQSPTDPETVLRAEVMAVSQAVVSLRCRARLSPASDTHGASIATTVWTAPAGVLRRGAAAAADRAQAVGTPRLRGAVWPAARGTARVGA
jgi:hypothetical protein